ncbi:MAG: proline--tRNA ligase, partial [Pyrinomonadaceae bacterium]|nr:proline--tRNA ligase [Pyrinomonadaceae bacterium]
MLWSKFFIPTLRETPADAEVISHKLLLRAGMIRQLAAGIYSYLPLAQLSLNKIQAIIREEMNAIGGQEFFLPALNPREIWEESGRWSVMGDNMFRLKDRKGADLCLGMTHEEVFTAIARNELRSYKQLPQIWYQIQTKFRDEARPKSGLLRVRQFTMKDSYSFDTNQAGLDASFDKHRDAYIKIFTRCGLKFVMVEASSGAMGGSASTEFMVKTDAGEDLIAVSTSGNYAANLEKATSIVDEIVDENGLNAPEKFATPNIKTIEQLENFEGGAKAVSQIKTLIYVASFENQKTSAIENKFVLALIRGDHQLQETKLSDALKAIEVRPAQDNEIVELLGAHAGSLGAFNAKETAKSNKKEVVIIADSALKNRKNMTTGANEDDFHLRGIDVARDLQIDTFADLREVKNGETAPDGNGVLEIYKSLEIGHIFKLGTKYSDSMNAKILDSNGKAVPIVMGSYGIGVERILASVIEQNADENGIVWSKETAPFDVVVTITNIKQPELVEAGHKIYRELLSNKFDVLLDDRDERAGVKFKDAELIGIPFRVTIGKKMDENIVELFNRQTKQTEDVKVDEL